jgi:hypothetical protein
MIEFRAE